jgi:hypothetical protein
MMSRRQNVAKMLAEHLNEWRADRARDGSMSVAEEQ